MTSSTSCSSRVAPSLAVVLALLCGACAGARPAPSPASPYPRIALFPIENRSGTSAPMKRLQVSLEVALRARGLSVASGDNVERFLAAHRIRYTGGLDRPTALAAKEELGVDGVLVASIDLYGVLGALQYGMSMRLVSTGQDPTIRWMDGTARTADDSPGLFNLGVPGNLKELEDRVISRLTESLVSHLQGNGPRIGTCSGGSRFRSRTRYRSSIEREKPLSLAVLPFVNQTSRSSAGDAVALEFVRQLASLNGPRVLEPGIVRTELLRHRVVMQGGVSHEAARVALGSMEVDLVVSGYVWTYEEQPVPKVEFTVTALETRSNRIVWQSSSYNRGDDGVFFFDAGRVTTASVLACRMARNVAEEMAGTLSPATQSLRDGQ